MGRHAQREGQGDLALGGLVHKCEVVPVSIEIRAGMIGWSCGLAAVKNSRSSLDHVVNLYQGYSIRNTVIRKLEIYF